jgi:hypothetical protein
MTYGWDYGVYVASVRAMSNGQNPYDFNIISTYENPIFGTVLIPDYPPHTFRFFQIINYFPIFDYRSLNVYYSIMGLLFLLALGILSGIDKKPDYVLLATFAVTGFMALEWDIVTGNIPILFMFLLTVAFVLIAKGYYEWSGIVMGISAAVSLFTAPFILLLFFTKRSLADRIKTILLTCAITVSFFVMDAIFDHALFLTYFQRTFGSSNTFIKPGGWLSPVLFLLLKDIIGNGILWIVICAAFIVTILLLVGIYYKDNGPTLKTISIAAAGIFILLPFAGPYDFIILVVPLYVLFKDSGFVIKTIAVSVAALPVLVNILCNTNALPFPLMYIQSIGLMGIFVLAWLCGTRIMPFGNGFRMHFS